MPDNTNHFIFHDDFPSNIIWSAWSLSIPVFKIKLCAADERAEELNKNNMIENYS